MAAFNKHGEDAFTFEVLEHVGNTVQLIPREQYHLDTLKPEYNIAPIAGSRLGCYPSRETCNKMSKAWTPERRERLSVAMRGKRNPSYGGLSIEHRRKLSIVNKGKHLSEQHKQKLREVWTPACRQAQSDRLRGTHRSKETKEKIRAAWTPEKRRVKSTALAGEQNPNYGKHPSEETRLKMSQSQKAR